MTDVFLEDEWELEDEGEGSPLARLGAQTQVRLNLGYQGFRTTTQFVTGSSQWRVSTKSQMEYQVSGFVEYWHPTGVRDAHGHRAVLVSTVSPSPTSSALVTK
jgi:hypothetical protein